MMERGEFCFSVTDDGGNLGRIQRMILSPEGETEKAGRGLMDERVRCSKGRVIFETACPYPPVHRTNHSVLTRSDFILVRGLSRC